MISVGVWLWAIGAVVCFAAVRSEAGPEDKPAEDAIKSFIWPVILLIGLLLYKRG